MKESNKALGSPFVHHVMDQLTFIEGLRGRVMFGGVGIFQNDRMFAIILKGVLYLKSDEHSKVAFESRGCPAFFYASRGKSVRLSYYEAPPEVFEDQDALREWVNRSLCATSV